MNTHIYSESICQTALLKIKKINYPSLVSKENNITNCWQINRYSKRVHPKM